MEGLHFFLIFHEGASSGFKVDSVHSLVGFQLEGFDEAHLGGGLQMSAAAGHAGPVVVSGAETHQSDVFFDGQRLSHGLL